MVKARGERLTPKVLAHYLDHYLIMLQLLWLCSFTHLRRPRPLPKFHQFFDVPPKTPPQNFITICSLNFLSNVVQKQTDRQVDKCNSTKNITSLFAKEVIRPFDYILKPQPMQTSSPLTARLIMFFRLQLILATLRHDVTCFVLFSSVSVRVRCRIQNWSKLQLCGCFATHCESVFFNSISSLP